MFCHGDAASQSIDQIRQSNHLCCFLIRELFTMQKVSFKAPAKVNLTLDVLGRDPEGYHRIQTVYHEVPEFYDELFFEFLDETTIELTTDSPSLPCDETNTVYRAASILQKNYAPNRGARIHLLKKIPLAAGLGGGSSNAATTLKALNELWQLNLSHEQLLTHAAEIGMDVPFFILRGCALGMHYGEHLMPLPTLQTVTGYENARIEIHPGATKMSTAEAYAALDLSKCGQRTQDTATLMKILKGEKIGAIDPLLHNDFKTPSTSPWHLSGSGGSRFRIIKRDAQKIADTTYVKTHVSPPTPASM